LLRDRGRVEEAIEQYRRAGSYQAWMNAGALLHDRQRYEEAAAAWQVAAAQHPDSPDAHSNLAQVLARLGRHDEAIRAGEQAVRLRPDLPGAYNNLGTAYQSAGRSLDAADAFRRALALAPDLVPVHTNLGNVLLAAGDVAQAAEQYRRAIEIGGGNDSANPDIIEPWDNLLLTAHYRAHDPAKTFELHHRWGSNWSKAAAGGVTFDNSRDPDRRLRIGYVSPDFRRHSVAFFIESILAGHDRRQFEVFCYSNVWREDDVTARLRALPLHWRSITAASDAQAASMIRADGIDLLIDLAGHTGGNRLRICAHRPAPLQLTYLGYPGTSGLAAMDYRLTGAIADPPGEADGLCTERLIRLPTTAWCYRPPADAPPPVSDAPPAPVTFGCFNALPKIGPDAMAAWSQVLRAVPGSRLMLKAHALADEAVRRRVTEQLRSAGIAPDRVELLGRTSALAEHLGRYHRVSIALDTFPYNGTTTTCEALWMGVPVVTLTGRTHASRVGASLLHSIGLGRCVAGTVDEYIDAVVRMTGETEHPPRGRRLREMMADSPLRDEQAFVGGLESALRDLWRQWCGRA
jgi:predicted O-linked N-acetylglucosamine transferase (SPINDLY family)